MIPGGAGLPEEMRSAMIAHAAAAAPREACGLVAYDRSSRPVRLYRMTNVHPDPDRFEISPVEHFEVIQEAEERGWRIGAVYHSHPRGPARPSPADLRAGLDEDWISFVVGRRPGGWKVAPFLIRKETARRLAGPISLTRAPSPYQDVLS